MHDGRGSPCARGEDGVEAEANREDADHRELHADAESAHDVEADETDEGRHFGSSKLGRA